MSDKDCDKKGTGKKGGCCGGKDKGKDDCCGGKDKGK